MNGVWKYLPHLSSSTDPKTMPSFREYSVFTSSTKGICISWHQSLQYGIHFWRWVEKLNGNHIAIKAQERPKHGNDQNVFWFLTSDWSSRSMLCVWLLATSLAISKGFFSWSQQAKPTGRMNRVLSAGYLSPTPLPWPQPPCSALIFSQISRDLRAVLGGEAPVFSPTKRTTGQHQWF